MKSEVTIRPRGTPTIVMKITIMRREVRIKRASPVIKDLKKFFPEISEVWERRFGARYNTKRRGKRREKKV